jgi:putative ABC transport system ATP-binding protein
MDLLEAENIGKIYVGYGIETVALKGIHLRIKQGDFVSVMGPSGCGKSTLLNLLGMLDVPSSGKLLFMGKDTVAANSKERALIRRSHIGFVFQNFNLIDELTVYENIELPLRYQPLNPQERKDRVLSVMERLNIAHKQHHFPLMLSGGQQQRVAMARAIIAKPSLIVADEPTGNLDSARGQEVLELLLEMNDAGTSIVMATHSASAADYGNRTINLFDGQIVTENIVRPRLEPNPQQ